MTYRTALAIACGAMVTLGAATNAAAEEERTTPRAGTFGGAAYLMPGVRQLQLGDVNDALEGAGYSRIGQTTLSPGLGGHTMLHRFRIGGEGHFLAGIGGDAERGTTRASVAGGYGMFRFGYAVVASERFSLYPMIGVGGGGLSLTFREQGDTNFGAILAEPRRDATLNRGGLLVDAALSADYRIPLARDNRGERFLLVGARGSYTYGPAMGNWSSAGGAVRGGPDLGLTGPSLHLLIGLGGLGPLQ